MKLLTVSLAILLLTGCAGSKEFISAGSQSFKESVPPTATVRLQLAAGAVVIRGVNRSEITAHVELKCQEGDRGCVRRAEKVKFKRLADTSAILLSLEPSSMMSWHDLQATIDIEVPDDRALHVRMGAGDIQVIDMKNCVELDMYAGDATVRVQKSVVGSVDLDVGTGDTSLVVDGQSREGKRALLVGAELKWNDGNGWCQVYGDLQFGDLTVYLED